MTEPFFPEVYHINPKLILNNDKIFINTKGSIVYSTTIHLSFNELHFWLYRKYR